MPRTRGVSFRRPGATSKVSFKENQQKKKEMPCQFLNSLTSYHFEYPSQATNDENKFDAHHAPQEKGDGLLRNVTPHEENIPHRIKPRSRKRKRKRNIGNINFCAEDSVRFPDERTTTKTGTISCISNSHNNSERKDFMETSTCASATGAVDKPAQNNIVPAEGEEDLSFKYLPVLLSRVTPDAKKKNLLSAKRVVDVTFIGGKTITNEDNDRLDINNESEVMNSNEFLNASDYPGHCNMSKSNERSAGVKLFSPDLFPVNKCFGVTFPTSDTPSNELFPATSVYSNKQNAMATETSLSPNNPKETELNPKENPNTFINAWKTFFEDFDSKQKLDTEQAEENMSKECDANVDNVMGDKNDSNISKSKSKCNDHVNNFMSKPLDYIILKEDFFKERLEMRRRHEQISPNSKPEATEGAMNEIFDMSSLAIITDASLAQLQTGDGIMCPCSCRNGAMLDVVLSDDGGCDTLRWTLICSVGEKSTDKKFNDDQLRKSPEYATLIWEAQVLHILRERVTKWLNQPELAAIFLNPEALRFECGCSGKVSSILDLSVFSVTASVTQKSTTGIRNHNVKILGTLQDIFNLHVQFCVGPIPEPVIACLVLQILEIITVLHHCGVAHNNLGLESFLLIQEENIYHSDTDEDMPPVNWSLRLIDFGDNSSILVDHHIVSTTNKKFNGHTKHFEKDMHSLAGIVQALLLGGAKLMEPFGNCNETLIMPVISDNHYLRGRLAWKELIISLLQSNMGLIEAKFFSSPNKIDFSRSQFLQNNRNQNNETCALTNAITLLETVSNKVNMMQYLEQALQHQHHTRNVANNIYLNSPFTKLAEVLHQSTSSLQDTSHKLDRTDSKTLRQKEAHLNESGIECESLSKLQSPHELNDISNEKIRQMSELVTSHEKEIAQYKQKIEEMERVIEEKNRLLSFEHSWRKKQSFHGTRLTNTSPQHTVNRVTEDLSPNLDKGQESEQSNDNMDGKSHTKHEEELTPHRRHRSSLFSGRDCNFLRQHEKQSRGRVVVCLDDSSDSDDDSVFC